MKDNEIIKALEVCGNDLKGCHECPKKFDGVSCMEELQDEAVELIKRQRERIEDLEVLVGMQRKRKYYNRFVKEVWQKEHGKLSYPDFDEIYKRYFDQQERLDKLPERIHKYFVKQAQKRANGMEEVPMGLVADILEHNKGVCEIIKAVQE